MCSVDGFSPLNPSNEKKKNRNLTQEKEISMICQEVKCDSVFVLFCSGFFLRCVRTNHLHIIVGF